MEAAKSGWRQHRQVFDERQLALCEFTEKLSLRPSAMTPEDLDSLRAQGLDDGEIIEVVHIIGYFSHINRIADALGIDLEDWMPDRPEEL